MFVICIQVFKINNNIDLLFKDSLLKIKMAAKGEFNIFSKNYDEPNKYNAVQLFSTVNSTNQN